MIFLPLSIKSEPARKDPPFHASIIPRVRVGYEMVVIISYPTSASGIIVSLKTPSKSR